MHLAFLNSLFFQHLDENCKLAGHLFKRSDYSAVAKLNYLGIDYSLNKYVLLSGP